MPQDPDVRIRFFPPPDALRRYFTSFYLTEIALPEGETVTDHLHPEWGNLRFHSGALTEAVTRDGTRLTDTPFTATGPSTETLRFTTGSARIWGVGLLPLGWAKFVGAPAGELANAAVDGHDHPAFASFQPLAREIFDDRIDCAAELARINRHFLRRADEPLPRGGPADEERILAIHAALIDPETATVGELVARSGVSQRTVERVCHRAFGFSPKLLLRRQRFMRSLTMFMLDPSLKWSGAMDGRYHDQAQFVRDFRQFMGMTPTRYAALPKPILAAVMRERARMAGAAVQTLDGPGGARLRR